MQIEEIHRALNTLTKEEQELMEAIFYKEESLRSIGGTVYCFFYLRKIETEE